MKIRTTNNQLLAGYIFAIAATAIWSANFIIARGLNENISPIALAFWRWLVAVIAILPFSIKHLLNQKHLLKKHLPYLAITSLLGITIFNTLIYFAGHSTTAVNLSLISITFPVFIVIFSRFIYGEKITVNRGAGILIVAAGIIFLVTKGNVGSILNISFSIGDLWMLLAAITFAAYSLLLKRKPDNLNIWAFQLCTFSIGLLLLLPFYLWDLSVSPPVRFDLTTLGAILYIGIFASLSAFVLWNKAIAIIGPARAGMLYYSLPLFSGLLAHMVLKEDISIVHFYSALLIIAGILTANSKRLPGKSSLIKNN